jgi:hypothetical protein
MGTCLIFCHSDQYSPVREKNEDFSRLPAPVQQKNEECRHSPISTEINEECPHFHLPAGIIQQ